MFKKFMAVLMVIAAVTVSLVAASPATATSVAATPNWWTCSSYDKVCFNTDVSMDPLGRQLNVYSVGVGCINTTSSFNDAITSIDNAWNDADIRLTMFKDGNCLGSSKNLDGNDAVNLNSNSEWWGFNDHISSFKIECVDFFGQCYYGP